MRDRLSKEAATKLGEALGYIAWEQGATEKRGQYCDCVGVEESEIMEAIVEVVEGMGEKLLVDGAAPIYDLIHDTMYATARRLARERGDCDIETGEVIP
jgi:hypothetical protein